MQFLSSSDAKIIIFFDFYQKKNEKAAKKHMNQASNSKV